jgi:ATP-binding cassette subfamily B protein
VARYRGRALLAFIALTIAAVTTLLVPVAVRRMIDFGFTPEGIAMINSYFSVMIAVVAVLAGASAARFYLVMTIGERIVADLRRDVFAHLISLSPSFFDSARSGELISRLTATPPRSSRRSAPRSRSALRNMMLFVGATTMMVITSPRLSGFVLLAIPVIVIPLVAFGRWVRRLSRNAQDTLADATSYASELIGAIRTVQAYTSERLANARFGGEVEQAYEAARSSTRARAVLTAIIIFIVFSSVVAILWIGSNDVLTGSITPGRLGQFVLYAAFAAAASASSARSGARCRRRPARGTAVRDPARQVGDRAPASPRALPCRARGDVASKMSASPIRPGRMRWRSMACRCRARRREGRDRRPLGRGKSTLFHLCCGSTIPARDDLVRRRADQGGRSARVRARIALVPQDSVVFAATRAKTSASAGPMPTDAEVERAADWPTPPNSSAGCPAASNRSSANAA